MKDTVKVAKSLAKQIADTLTSKGQVLAKGEALELVAHAWGFRNWHAFLSAHKAAAKPEKSKKAPAAWSPAQGPMSDAEYVRREGCRCPVCGHKDGLEGDSIDVDAGTATQEMSCSNCEASWNDVYSLVGWGQLERTDAADEPNSAKEIGFIYAIQLWLKGEDEDFDEDQQELLDELVTDACHAENTPVVNGASSKKQQEQLRDSAELRATDINNQGMTAQLQFLKTGFASQETFTKYLADKFELDLSDLTL